MRFLEVVLAVAIVSPVSEVFTVVCVTSNQKSKRLSASVDDVDDVDVTTDILKGEALKALLRTISIRKDESVLFD